MIGGGNCLVHFGAKGKTMGQDFSKLDTIKGRKMNLVTGVVNRPFDGFQIRRLLRRNKGNKFFGQRHGDKLVRLKYEKRSGTVVTKVVQDTVLLSRKLFCEKEALIRMRYLTSVFGDYDMVLEYTI